MKPFTAPEFEAFKQHLRYYDENILGNLTPFFEAKLFALDSRAEPASIIASAYPETEVEKAKIRTHSTAGFDAGIKEFFCHMKDRDDRHPAAMADAFLSGVWSCISVEDSKVWEYVPDWRGLDQLYDYIAFGFTYIIVNRDETRCLVIHGGYMD
jgi:hypothetical protein